jgi:hypothetical protein
MTLFQLLSSVVLRVMREFDWRKTSLDVEARVTSERNHGIIIDAVHEAAKQLHLPRSWLNESVAAYARRGEGDADRILIGLYPSPERFGLRVTAGPHSITKDATVAL